MKKEREAVAAYITVRGGGSTLYRKNLYVLRGKPVLQHAIEACFATGFVSHVFVWTEDDEAKQVAEKSGAHALDRPLDMVHYHAGFHSIQEWSDNRSSQANQILPGGGLVQLNLNCNNFLVKPATLQAMYDRLLDTPTAFRITAVSRIDPQLCFTNPNTGYLMPFWDDPHTAPEAHPQLYRMVGASIAHAGRQAQNITDGLYHEVSAEEALDFQTQHDIALAEFYLGRRGA